MARSASEAPTPRRLARARREGDHPVAPSLTAAPGWIACAILLPLGAGAVLDEARELLSLGFVTAPDALVQTLPERVAWLVAPFLLVIAAGAAAAGLWQTGGAVSARPLAPKWSPLNPSAFTARLRAGTPLASLSIFAAASCLLGWLAWRSVYVRGPALARSIGDLELTAALAADLAGTLLWSAAVIGVFGAALEKLARQRAWLHRHRMTRDEIEREQREHEGDPALEQARQRSHREILEGAHLTRLRAAALLVADPARLIVALQYDPRHDPAPVVLFTASGADAQRIRSFAEDSGIPVSHDAELARQLGRLPEGDAIPPSLYAPVAEALEPHVRQRLPDAS